jgi:ABC-type Fe3+-hydroxamate transport system substrate-binding protein
MVSMHTVTDQMGRQVSIPVRPLRIVSLVPSQTELLYDFGLDDRVVGITKFCIHPTEWYKTKTRVGGTKNVHFDVIEKLQPDLIIGNKEENDRDCIEQLMQKYPVWMSDIKTLADAKAMIAAIGSITQTDAKAVEIITKIDNGFAQVQPLKPTKSSIYLIWRGPYMAAGADTFINHILELCGFYIPGILSENDIRYPELDEDQLFHLNPEYIFLSSEPYPFKDKHIKELQEIVPNAKIMLVDGEMFSWYGSRLIHSGPYLANLFNSPTF